MIRNEFVPACLFVLVTCSALHAQHAGDLVIGRRSSGQLAIEADLDHALPLAPVSGLFNGWADTEPGFEHLEADEPDEDLLQLEAGASIRLELLEVPPAFRVLDVNLHVADQAGETLALGNHALHVHVTWHVNSSHPLFDDGQHLWSPVLRVTDAGSTGYGPSEPFVMHFVNLDCRSGDADGSEAVDLEDVDDFVTLLLDPSQSAAEQRCAADLNFDGIVDGRDVQPFIETLILKQ